MEKVVESFWKNKKVFLTGHTGFKGSWLSLWLTEMGAKVTGYALAPSTIPSLFALTQLGKDLISIEADIRDFSKLKEEMQKAEPEIVIHMAAQPLVRASYDNPLETYATNVMGTAHIHEAARSLKGLKVLINVTTDKCYENKERLEGYKEDEALGGYDPYSNSKACSELVTSAYRQSFFNPKDYSKHGVAVASARAGNVIGGGDWSADRLLPDIFRALEKKEAVIIRNPQAIRPWQHVLEPLSGYLVLAQKLYGEGAKYASAYNFGPNDKDTQTVEKIAEQVVKIWGDGAKLEMTDKSGPHEAKLLTLDCTKAKKLLNWAPRLTLDKALPSIVSWYKAVGKDSSQARALCIEEIKNYQRL